MSRWHGAGALALCALLAASQLGRERSALVSTAQDAADAAARLSPVERVSIFDQWTAPNKTAEEDFATSNPSFAYVAPYVTGGRRYDAETNALMAAQCRAKCAPRPGYNPSADVLASCLTFCRRLEDDNAPVPASPQPATRSWSRRKSAGPFPGGRYMHYLHNPFAGGSAPKRHIPDPYSDRPLGQSIANIPNDPIVGMSAASWGLGGPAPAAKPAAQAPTQPPAAKPAAKPAGSGPPLSLSRAKAAPARLQAQRPQQLLMTGLVVRGAAGQHGLEGAELTTASALQNLDDYFDTLPTTDCNRPTCDYVDTRQVLTLIPAPCTLQPSPHNYTRHTTPYTPYTHSDFCTGPRVTVSPPARSRARRSWCRKAGPSRRKTSRRTRARCWAITADTRRP